MNKKINHVRFTEQEEEKKCEIKSRKEGKLTSAQHGQKKQAPGGNNDVKKLNYRSKEKCLANQHLLENKYDQQLNVLMISNAFMQGKPVKDNHGSVIAGYSLAVAVNYFPI
ncbi:CLUMA_CG016846, isoform A [Clunio marinus]|uniref:CLUMA_CG016846, isoform A n=1 Tax=Clunio marinus TaxID=568069 RepID=A0A1J1IVA1_9DIPT|nr:CLUMA_CG016846, isoform A [Clunio marinus]